MKIYTSGEINKSLQTKMNDCAGRWQNFYDKKWVSLEDMKKLFDDDSITCFEDLRDFVLNSNNKM